MNKRDKQSKREITILRLQLQLTSIDKTISQLEASIARERLIAESLKDAIKLLSIGLVVPVSELAE